MGKRYKAIKRALQYARKKDAQGNLTGEPIIDADSPLAQYQDYRGEKIKLSYARTADSKPEELVQVTVLPFAHAAAASTDKNIIKISKRVQTGTVITNVVTLANLNTTIEDGAEDVKGFVPAKAYVSIVSETQVSTDQRQSQITGIRYDPIDKKSYTIPFGAAVSKGYLAVKKDILLAAQAITPGKGKVRFKNEII